MKKSKLPEEQGGSIRINRLVTGHNWCKDEYAD
jgi:hypothetical protein